MTCVVDVTYEENSFLKKLSTKFEFEVTPTLP